MTKQWAQFRPLIVRLYKEENRPLHEVRKILDEEYNFKASTRAFRTRFEKWKINKYNCQKRRNSASSMGSPSWHSDSTPIASPTMPAATHVVSSEAASSPCQMSPALTATYRESTEPSAPSPPLPEVSRYDTSANLPRAFDLPVRPAQYPLCPPEISPIASPSEPYLGFFNMPLMYPQELGQHSHDQFRLDGFTGLDDGEYKPAAAYLKHEVEH